jgi:hypothetical protein
MYLQCVFRDCLYWANQWFLYTTTPPPFGALVFQIFKFETHTNQSCACRELVPYCTLLSYARPPTQLCSYHSVNALLQADVCCAVQVLCIVPGSVYYRPRCFSRYLGIRFRFPRYPVSSSAAVPYCNRDILSISPVRSWRGGGSDEDPKLS